jgi:hypothetical protein
MQISPPAKPLSDALDNHLIQEWVKAIPELKTAFIDGTILGIAFGSRPVVFVAPKISNSLLAQLGAITRVEVSNG